MNRYALYALKSDGNDYARTDAIENCSFNGGTNFTFGMDIYCTMQNGLVFSQNNSISCLLQSGSIVWKGIGWELIADKNYSAVMMDEWNHIDVVYDTSKVSLYLNGVLASETETVGEPVYSTDEYRYLGGYCGYIKNVRIVDHAMTEKEIRENLIITAIPEEKLWLYIPFDSTKPEDKGIYKKQVQCKGFCYCKDFVKALYFTGKGYALLDGVSDNPGSDQCPAFTIVMRIFPDGYTSDAAVLFENSGSNDLLQICLLKESKLQINIGTNQIVTDEIQAIKDCLWTDIAVSVNGTDLKVYAGGVLVKADTIEKYVRTSYPHMMLGNNFIGAIDYFAIYGENLTDDYIVGIHNIEPYIFDSGLNTLFLFHGEQETNMLGSGSILLHDEAAFSMLEGTLYDEQPETFDFRIGEGFAGSDLEDWGAILIAGLGISFVSAAIGMAIKEGAVNDGLKKLILDRLLNSNEAQSILGNYSNITQDQIAKLMTSSSVGRGTVGAMASTLTKGAVSGAMAVTAAKSASYPLILGTAVGASAVAAIAAVAATLAKKPSDPPDDDEEEKEPEKGYNLYLESIQLCNESDGSIPLRSDFDTPQAVPEWNKGNTQSVVAAYIAKQQSPKITIRFKYLPAKDQKPVKVKFYLGNFDLLGAGESEEVECSVAGTVYEANIICNNNKLHEAGMGKQHGKASFRFEPVGGDKDAPTNIRIKYVDMDIHMLCREPIEPWSIKDKTKAPLIPVLDVVAEIVGDIDKVVTSEEFLKCIQQWYNSKSNYELETKSRFCTEKLLNIQFNFREFFKMVQNNNVTAGILDFFMYAAEIIALEGIDFNIYVVGGLENNLKTNEGLMVQSSGITFNECKIFGKLFEKTVFRTYVFGLFDKDGNIKYSELLFNKENKNLINISKEDYVKEVISQYCYIEPMVSVNAWNDNNNNNRKVYYDPIYQHFSYSKRIDFKDFINQVIYLPDNLARCHRISYDTIENILVDLFNYSLFKNSSETDDVRNIILDNLLNMFYVDASQYSSDPYYENICENNECMKETIEELKKFTYINFVQSAKAGLFNFKLNGLLSSFNSSLNNLKEGNTHWNSSISSKYDPESWVYKSGVNSEGIPCGYTSENVDNIISLPSEYADFPEGFYLESTIDVFMIEHLLGIQNLLKHQYIDFGIKIYNKDDNTSISILSSSNNNLDFRRSISIFCNSPVFIKKDAQWMNIY